MTIKSKLSGKDRSRKKLPEVFEFHNKLVKEKVDERYTLQTLRRYETTCSHVLEFMQHHNTKEDIYVSELN